MIQRAQLPSLRRLLGASLLTLAASAAPLVATDDWRDDLWLRVEDARALAGGQVAIALRTEWPFAVGSGRIVVAATLLDGTGGAGTPFSACSSATVFSGEDDAQVANFTFDVPTQRISFDFSSTSGTINSSPGVFGAFFCQVAPGAVEDDEFQLDLVGGAGGTMLLDPAGVAWLVEPRAGELRVRDSLDASIDAEDTEVKPGAAALIEIETEFAFAIESGAVDLEIDPALVSGTPSVVALPNHGAVVIDQQSWDAGSGRFRFAFSSADASLNAGIPGALFLISMPTVADDSLLGQTYPLVLIAADSFLVGPGATPMSVELEDGTLLFTDSPDVEDVYRDGFAGGSTWGWTSITGLGD